MNNENAEEYCDQILECDENHLQEAIEVFDKLEKVYLNDPTEEVAVFVAKALFNLAYYSFNFGSQEEAFKFLKMLDKLGVEHKESQEVLWNMAHCYANFINGLSDSNLDEAFELFELLLSWHKTCPKNEDIALYVIGTQKLKITIVYVKLYIPCK